MKNILLLTDYRNHFYSSNDHYDASIDLVLLKEYFKVNSYNLIIKNFSDIDFKNEDYKNKFILYQSSEDRNLFYKGYIEDIILGLHLKQAVLIPEFHLFRAHHNKVFMEIIRDIADLQEIKNINADYYGTYEEYLTKIEKYNSDNYVLKPSSGAKSANIKLLNSSDKKIKYPKKISGSFHLIDYAKTKLAPFLKKIGSDYLPKSNNRNKFIIQNYIADYDLDFKVLIYGSKYYILLRKPRKDDFRASGSGFFSYTEKIPDGILDYTEKVFNYFKVPFISLDIICKNGNFYVIEFQFLHFGNYTLQVAPFYFKKIDNKWQTIREKSILEKEFADSVSLYIEKYFQIL